MVRQTVQLIGTSPFGRGWIHKMGKLWCVNKITDHVLFSDHPGPWMLVELNHFQRWVNLNADQNFLIQWAGWKKEPSASAASITPPC